MNNIIGECFFLTSQITFINEAHIMRYNESLFSMESMIIHDLADVNAYSQIYIQREPYIRYFFVGENSLYTVSLHLSHFRFFVRNSRTLVRIVRNFEGMHFRNYCQILALVHYTCFLILCPYGHNNNNFRQGLFR